MNGTLRFYSTLGLVFPKFEFTEITVFFSIGLAHFLKQTSKPLGNCSQQNWISHTFHQIAYIQHNFQVNTSCWSKLLVDSRSNGCSLQNLSASFHCISHHMHNSLIVKISQEHNIMNTIYESHRTFDKCITAIDKSVRWN